MAPIGYSENIFTLIADIMIFHYHFIITDIIGMIVIVICLMIPVVLKLKEINK